MKKGIDIQLTWIFVLITGAVIFVFFMTVVSKQKEIAEDKTSLAVKSKLASVMLVASVGSHAFNTFDAASIPVEFSCTDPETAAFRIGKRGASDQLNGIVFTQSRLQGDALYAWSLDWLLPYRAATFLLVANERTKFIFYKATPSDSFMDWLLADFPGQVPKSVITSPTDTALGSSGFDTYVIVQKAGNELNPTHDFSRFTLSRERIYILTITPNVNREFGEIGFKQLRSPNTAETDGPGYYYRKEMLYGALFSPELPMFRCMMQRSFVRAKAVTELNYRRVGEIHDNATSTIAGSLGVRNPHCRDLYGYIKYTFDNKTYPYCGNVKIMEDVVKIVGNGDSPLTTARPGDFITSCGDCIGPSPCCSGGPCAASNDFQRLEDNYRRLVRESEDITLEGGCPYVY
jgi:hypothetical protein